MSMMTLSGGKSMASKKDTTSTGDSPGDDQKQLLATVQQTTFGGKDVWKTFWDTGLSLDYISVSRIEGHGLWKTLSDSGISRIVDGHFCSPKKVLKTQQLQLYTRSHLQKPPGCNQVPMN